MCPLKCPHQKLGAQHGEVKVFRPLRGLRGHQPWEGLIQFSQLSSGFLLCIPVSGVASSTDLHHSHTVALNLQKWELNKTIFITDYSEQMFHHSNTAWPNTDSKRQRKGWSVSSLSHLAIFENLLVVRGSLPSNGVHIT